LAIFASRLLNDRAPLVFEDGGQQRDFVSVHDVARACRLAYESRDGTGDVFNIGSGRARSVAEVARAIAGVLGKDIEPEIVGQYRVGDIRHCFADISRAREILGYEPRVSFESGLEELAHWLEGQTAVDHVAEAQRELDTRGLTVGNSRRTA
jgi:dTDP-L-rhamnose 4-epimerase